MTVPLERRLKDIIIETPSLMQVLRTAREINLPDWMIFSGAIYQRVLNTLTNRDLDYGVRDYDLGYFDPDTSYEAEDAIIRRVADRFEQPLRDMVEVRNQARVHLWFEAKFGETYAPLTCTAEAPSRFTTTAFAVGARLEANDSISIIAPFGLDDLFALTLRPNPNRVTGGFKRTAQSALLRWPELKVVE